MAYRIVLSERELAFISEKKKETKDYKIRRKLDALLQLNKGVGARAVARGMGVVNNTVTRWIKQYQCKGIKHYSQSHHVKKSSVLDAHQEWLKEQVEKENIKTMPELNEKLSAEHGVKVSSKWLRKYCKKNSVSPIRRPV